MNIVIIGASGAIGQALVNQLSVADQAIVIYAFSRSHKTFESTKVKSFFIDLENESSIKSAASLAKNKDGIDLIIVATGLLHSDTISPEKSLRDLTAEKFKQLFATNTIGPALVMKHFLPLLSKDRKSIFAALSARVGSINDNKLGGWYAYRASKAALNMVIRTASIEMSRQNKHAIVVGLHPGTVDSPLSKPFQQGTPVEKIFTPEYAATKLLQVIIKLTPESTGKFFAWDGTEIPC